MWVILTQQRLPLYNGLHPLRPVGEVPRSWALGLARRFGGEIIDLDSRGRAFALALLRGSTTRGDGESARHPSSWKRGDRDPAGSWDIGYPNTRRLAISKGVFCIRGCSSSGSTARGIMQHTGVEARATARHEDE